MDKNTTSNRTELTQWPEQFCTQYHEQGIWQNENLAGWLDIKLNQYTNRTLLTGQGLKGEDWQELSGSQVRLAINLAANHFMQLGLQQGDKVIMQMANNNGFVLTLFTLLKLGVIPVMALPGHGQREIRQFIQLTKAKAWFVNADSASFDCNELGHELLNTIPDLKHVIIDSQYETSHIALSSLIANANEKSDIELAEPTLSGHNVDPSAIALLLCSGGTTGIPKLIPRTHKDYIYNAKASAYVCQLKAEDCYLVALPAAHNFPLACPGLLGALEVGANIVMCPAPNPDLAFKYIQRAQVTVTALVPTLVKTWIEHAKINTPPAESLRLLQVGGAKLDERIARSIKKELGCELQQVFGMAEGLLNFTREKDPIVLKLKTQGYPLSKLDEIRIVNENGQDVPHGQCGELLTRGPYTIRGYYKAPQANKESFTKDGYYRTGDRVKQLSTGHLIVEGRIKEVIRRAGEVISVETLESLLASHSAIRDAAVIGLPCEQLGEKTCAVLVLEEPIQSRLTLQNIRHYLSTEGIAQHMLPDDIAFTKQIPLTAVGKVARVRLSEQIQQKIPHLEQKESQ